MSVQSLTSSWSISIFQVSEGQRPRAIQRRMVQVHPILMRRGGRASRLASFDVCHQLIILSETTQ